MFCQIQLSLPYNHSSEIVSSLVLLWNLQVTSSDLENKTVNFVIEPHEETLASFTLDSLKDSVIAYRSYYGTEDYMRNLKSNFSKISNLYRYGYPFMFFYLKLIHVFISMSMLVYIWKKIGKKREKNYSENILSKGTSGLA